MAESSWPFHDGVDGTPVLEDQWSYMARQWAATGVVGAPGDANLQVFANGSGMEVHVRSGRASVRGHWFLSDAQETLAIAANSSGNPRIDRVVVQLDPSSNEATLAVLTGTPGTVPTAPSLTQTDTGVYELTLAQVAVVNGAASISALNVTDERTFTSVPYTPALSSLRPSSPVKGQRVWESDTGVSKVWNGSAWVNDQQALFDAAVPAEQTYTPEVASWTLGNGSVSGRYVEVGPMVFGQIRLILGSTSVVSYVYPLRFTLPKSLGGVALTGGRAMCITGGTWIDLGVVLSAAYYAHVYALSGNNFGVTYPGLTNGDQVHVSFSYLQQ